MSETAKTRWGILACGNIAKKFATGLQAVDDAELIACGSRTQDKAESFGEEFDVAHRHGSYESLASDPEVDAIYVASPHPMHEENTVLALEHGKAVLCEKPFAVNGDQARRMIDCAEANGCFLMEAMWTRFLPTMVKTRELLDSGRIGEVRMVMAAFAFRCGWNPESRLLNPQLAGGGLLDVGIYTIAFASMVLGQPDRITGVADIGRTGVDEHAALALHYPGGQIASLFCGVQTHADHTARIHGTDGYIVLPDFWHGRQLTVGAYGGESETLEPEFVGNGYNYQVEEVHRCLAAGKVQSDVLPWEETLENMQTMDELRGQWGLSYPFE